MIYALLRCIQLSALFLCYQCYLHYVYSKVSVLYNSNLQWQIVSTVCDSLAICTVFNGFFTYAVIGFRFGKKVRNRYTSMLYNPDCSVWKGFFTNPNRDLDIPKSRIYTLWHKILENFPVKHLRMLCIKLGAVMAYLETW